MLEKRGGAVLATGQQLKSSYLKSKQRLACALEDGEQLSYGVREEHRISLAFFAQMRYSLEAAGLLDRPEARTDREVPF